MARVADYSIVADSWVLEKNKHSVSFEVPSTIDAGSRSILGFMLHVENLDDMTLNLHMNGSDVWNWSYAAGNHLDFFQEVIPAGMVKPGTNVFSFESSSDDYRLVELSDIVVWWQANI